jgi:acetoacetyl-CoA synthetase
MVKEGELMWTPRPEWLAETNLKALMRWLERERGLKFEDYHALWRWSVEHLEDFWAAMWDYFGIDASEPYQRVLGRREMPGAEWFPGARLNYAQHVMRQEKQDAPALLFASETTPLSSMPWSKLAGDVRILATRLRAMGVRPGRVAVPDQLPGSRDRGATARRCDWSGCSPVSAAAVPTAAQIEPELIRRWLCYGANLDRRGSAQYRSCFTHAAARHFPALPRPGQRDPAGGRRPALA